MAHPSVIASFRARLDANFSRCAVYDENSFAEVPKDASPFIKIQWPYARTEMQTIGDEMDRDFLEEGAALVVLHLRTGSGTIQGREWLEEIAQLFRGKTFDAVECLAPDSPVEDDRNDMAGWYRLRMAVPYRTIIQG